MQEVEKNGVTVVAFTTPVTPGTHTHPLGTLMPLLSGSGQGTAAQVTVVGNVDAALPHAGVALDEGEKPAMHCGAAGMPVLFAGQLALLDEENDDGDDDDGGDDEEKQFPLTSAKRPIALQLPMAARRAKMAALLLCRDATDACVTTRLLWLCVKTTCVTLRDACACTSADWDCVREFWVSASVLCVCANTAARLVSAASARARSTVTLEVMLLSAMSARICSEETLVAMLACTALMLLSAKMARIFSLETEPARLLSMVRARCVSLLRLDIMVAMVAARLFSEAVARCCSLEMSCCVESTRLLVELRSSTTLFIWLCV